MDVASQSGPTLDPLFVFFSQWSGDHLDLHSYPTRRSSDLTQFSLHSHTQHFSPPLLSVTPSLFHPVLLTHSFISEYLHLSQSLPPRFLLYEFLSVRLPFDSSTFLFFFLVLFKLSLIHDPFISPRLLPRSFCLSLSSATVCSLEGYPEKNKDPWMKSKKGDIFYLGMESSQYCLFLIHPQTGSSTSI